PAGMNGMVVLFRYGTAVFINLNPVQEEEIIAGLKDRLIEPLADRESEDATISVNPDAEDSLAISGNLELKNAAPERLLLVAEALAVSVALAYDERRIA